MRLRRLTNVLLASAMMGWTLWALQPLQAGQLWHSYAQERRTIRAAILIPQGYSAIPSGYVFYLLGADSVDVPLGGGLSFPFYSPRPPGWDFVNPVATAAAGFGKNAAPYWTLSLPVIDAPLLQNFDVLLLPLVGGTVSLTVDQQRLLERWVDQGGLLWIDSQPTISGADAPDLGDFFLRPAVHFGARTRTVAAPKVAVDRNHPLLRGRYLLSDEELQWVGQQYPYGSMATTRLPAANPAGAPVPTVLGLSPLDGLTAGVNNPFPPNSAIAAVTLPQEVVGEVYDNGGNRYRTPAVVASRFGDGCIVMTACGVAAGISDWYAGLTASPALPPSSLELPQWALPDMKLAYNMIQWWMDWSGPRGRVRFVGDYPESIPGPPVMAWQDVIPAAPGGVPAPIAGPAVAPAGVVFAGSTGGVLEAWDAQPYRDRDLRDSPVIVGAIGGRADVKSDDGAPDYATGTAQDQLWNVVVPGQDPNDPNPRSPAPAAGIVGSPAVAITYDGTRPRRLVAVAAKTTDGQDGSLHAYLADAVDAGLVLASPNPLWSATIKRYDVLQPDQNKGLVRTGPVAVDEFFALLTTDSGTFDAPNRDPHLLIYDTAGAGSDPARRTNIYFEQPAADVPMSAGGRAASFGNPPATAMARAQDAVSAGVEPVQLAVATGNSLPRPGLSSAGMLYLTPLSVRFPAPAWNQAWLDNPVGTDTASNQAVQVYFPDVGSPGSWIQVPPHVDDDPLRPLNYVRSVSGGQIAIIFTRWSMFGWGPATANKYPLGFGDIWVRYKDTEAQWRDVRPLKLSPGSQAALNGTLSGVGNRSASLSGFVAETGYATPCVAGDDVFVGTDAINAYPSPSSEGQLVSHGLTAGFAQLNWRFVGDRYRGVAPPVLGGSPGGYYFQSFPFTAACAGDTVFAVANFGFFRRDSDQTTEPLTPGPEGALYALDLKAAPALVQPDTDNPVFPTAIDAVAPIGASADPNQVVGSGRRGSAVWISASLTDTSARFAIPAVAASQSNWRVDYQNDIVRLEAGCLGDLGCPMWNGSRYVRQPVRVRYFNAGVLQDIAMEVTPIVKWMYVHVPALDPQSRLAGWEFVSSPLVTKDRVLVAAYDHVNQRYLLLSWRTAPEDASGGTLPLWAQPAQPEYVYELATEVPSALPCSLAATADGILWSGNIQGVARLISLASPQTIIADNNRLLAADPHARALASQEATWQMRPGLRLADLTRPAALRNVAISDSYAERTFEPIARPNRVRTLPNGNLLVVNQGADSVVELDASGQVVWRYPTFPGEPYDDLNGNSLHDAGEPYADLNGNAQYDFWADLGGMTPEQARLLMPADAQRYYYQQTGVVSGLVDPEGVIRDGDSLAVEWVTTLIADSGNRRVLEVAWPLVNGRYRPDITNASGTPVYLMMVRELASPLVTDWPTAGGGWAKVHAEFGTVERMAAAAAPYPFLSAAIMCAVHNHPRTKTDAYQLLGQDRSVRLVQIGITWGAGAQVAASQVVPRLDGGGTPEDVNALRPRITPWYAGPENETYLRRDFLHVRQADLTVVPDTSGTPRYQTLIVDDVGVKAIDNGSWNDQTSPVYLTPVFEMRGAAPWLHPGASWLTDGTITRPTHALTTYEEEMVELKAALDDWTRRYGDPTTTGNYPPLISEPVGGPTTLATRAAVAWNSVSRYALATVSAGANTGAVPFLPFYAKRERNGQYLVVNGYPSSYRSGGPLEVMAAVTSEVLQVTPSLLVGQRVVHWQDRMSGASRLLWDHLIVPDPARSEYPALRGGAGPLRQPHAVDTK